MEIHERLARLERGERRYRWLLVAAVAAAPMAWTLKPAAAAAAVEADTVPAVAVRNPTGTVVATMRATDDGSSLTLCDATGKPRMLFAVSKSGPGIFLLDGKPDGVNRGVRLALSVNEKSGPSVALFNGSAAKPAASVKLKADGTMGTFIATDGGEQQFAFPKASVEEGDADGKTGGLKTKPAATPVGGKKEAGN